MLILTSTLVLLLILLSAHFNKMKLLLLCKNKCKLSNAFSQPPSIPWQICVILYFRLLEVISYKIYSIQREDVSLDALTGQGATKSYRIEEIPVDEVNMGSDETLIPVAHFHKVRICWHVFSLSDYQVMKCPKKLQELYLPYFVMRFSHILRVLIDTDVSTLCCQLWSHWVYIEHCAQSRGICIELMTHVVMEGSICIMYSLDCLSDPLYLATPCLMWPYKIPPKTICYIKWLY